MQKHISFLIVGQLLHTESGIGGRQLIDLDNIFHTITIFTICGMIMFCLDLPRCDYSFEYL